MRVLLVSDECGHPENTGYRRRIANIARALDLLGPLEWVVLTRPDPERPAELRLAPPDVEATVHEVPVRLRPRKRALARWVFSTLPWRVQAVDLPALREAVGSAIEPGRADLLFFTQLDTYLVCRPMISSMGSPDCLVVLDFNDIESHKVATRRRMLSRGRPDLARLAALTVDGGRWKRLELRAARQALTFVCSELDRGRAGGLPEILPNVVPPAPAGYVHAPRPDEPVLVFVGSLSYGPNVDAAEVAARHILPLVRKQIPATTLRIVGRGAPETVRRLGELPGVVVVGEVASVAPELARATVAIVPIRYGGGTRIKILEALAHQLPVVSTTIGAEGLELVDGVHYRCADDVAPFAAACIELLRDPARAAGIASAGAEFVDRYDAPRVRTVLAERLRAAHAGRRPNSSA